LQPLLAVSRHHVSVTPQLAAAACRTTYQNPVGSGNAEKGMMQNGNTTGNMMWQAMRGQGKAFVDYKKKL